MSKKHAHSTHTHDRHSHCHTRYHARDWVLEVMHSRGGTLLLDAVFIFVLVYGVMKLLSM